MLFSILILRIRGSFLFIFGYLLSRNSNFCKDKAVAVFRCRRNFFYLNPCSLGEFGVSVIRVNMFKFRCVKHFLDIKKVGKNQRGII